jgi:UPF0716 protein FxsA
MPGRRVTLKLLSSIVIILLLFEIILLSFMFYLLGAGYTILLLMMISMVGVLVAGREGFLVLQKTKDCLARGIMPGDQLLEGILILAGAGLLLIPGFLTDLISLVFLLPPCRRFLREMIKRGLKTYFETGKFFILFR